MPTASAALQNQGDKITLQLGNPPGRVPDQTAILSLTGQYTGCIVAIEGIPIGQALSSVPMPVAEMGLSNGSSASSPVGPLTSSGGPGSGYAFTVPSGIYSLIQLRLVSTGGGAIQAAIATTPAH
jgi:hypothetical protein